MKKFAKITYASILLAFLLALTFFSPAAADTKSELIAKDSGKVKITAQIGLSKYKCTVTIKDSKTIKDVKYINQNNVGLPTGCESVSTVMALNYLGVKITPDKFVDKYLKKSKNMFIFNPHEEFGGDPRTTDKGLGCYNTAIESAVNKLIKKEKIKLKVTVLNDVSISDICTKYIKNNIPVVFWATNGMQPTRESCTIRYNNEEHYWISPCHCLLLVGYDKDNYIFHDPLVNAYTKYPKSKVRAAYKGMMSQALVIEKA